MARLSRKEHLMNIAEALYAKNGISAVSLREINAAAECSPAALHYHFKNKEELIGALIDRNLPALLEKKHKHLLELQRGVTELTIENFVRSLLQPLVEVMYRDAEGERFIKFLANLHLEQNEMRHYKIIEKYTQDSWIMVFDVLKEFVPNFTERQIKIRWVLSLDLTMHTLSNMHPISRRVGGKNLHVQIEVLQTLCNFLVASSKQLTSGTMLFGDSGDDNVEKTAAQLMNEALFSAQ